MTVSIKVTFLWNVTLQLRKICATSSEEPVNHTTLRYVTNGKTFKNNFFLRIRTQNIELVRNEVTHIRKVLVAETLTISASRA